MSLFDKIKDHVGHTIEAVTYGDPDDPANVAIECTDCCVVITDEDAPGWDDDFTDECAEKDWHDRYGQFQEKPTSKSELIMKFAEENDISIEEIYSALDNE